MTCPFYVVTDRPSCALGEPDGRHCGPRQYPVAPCNLDEIGRGDAWRAVAPLLTEMAVYYADHPEKWDNLTHFALWYFWADAYLDAVGWSP